MSVTIILVVVIIILLIYIIFYYQQSSVLGLLNLNNTNPSILNSNISSPYSGNFSYKMWVYVNSWNNTLEKDICLANTSMRNYGIDPTTNFGLYLEQTSPTLHCVIPDTRTQNDIIVTKNFPIQRWVYIVISVNNKIVDCYIDGKLIVSRELSAMPKSTMGGFFYNINFGVFDAYLMKFSRTTSATDPQTVWNEYMKGNGSSFLSAYGLNLAVTKDNATIAQYKY